MSRLTRDGTAEPVSRDQILSHARGQGNIIFPVQLTTSRIGNLTRLIHTLLYVMTIRTYIHTYCPEWCAASISYNKSPKKVITRSFLALGWLHEDKFCDTLQAMAPINNVKTVHQTLLLNNVESNLDRLGLLSPTHDQRSQQQKAANHAPISFDQQAG